jgi:peptidoglycan hydrolase CwlO-like protein
MRVPVKKLHMRYQIKVIPLCVAGLFAVSMLFAPFIPVVEAATLQQQLEEIEKQLAAIRGVKNGLQSKVKDQQNKIGTYAGEIGKLRAETETMQLTIAELELQINELEVNIKIAEEKIASQEKEIGVQREAINLLADDAQQRISLGYKDLRTRGQNRVAFTPSDNVSGYFKDSQYMQIIQESTSRSMVELLELKNKLQQDQQILAEKTQEIKRNKTLIDEQKKQMTTKQNELKSQMEKYYGAIYVAQSNINSVQGALSKVSQDEMRKQAEAEKIRQAIFNSFKSIPNGRYVVKGTQVGRQGATGLATGPHVHVMVKYNGAQQNPCTYMRGPGCGGNGTVSYPLKGTFYFTSGYGRRCVTGWGCNNHSGIDIAHSVWNAPVYAPIDGYMYKGVDQYGGKYIIICEKASNCNSGKQVGLWHFSSY